LAIFFWRLEAGGVKRIFGYPGDGVNGIVTALGRAGDGIEFIQVRHEEEAASCRAAAPNRHAVEQTKNFFMALAKGDTDRDVHCDQIDDQ